ncbi:hypothetical protein ABZ464_39600 [Streptomyces sp. NPDC005820]|uniref:hypothetical protein n=1 Tax=Streptomyces sp. NPDC005820 TaxID=3157069 RepID=UPI0033F215F6
MKTRWYGSITPPCAEVPISEPPKKCAVIGLLKISPHVPAAMPPMCPAARRLAECPAGMNVGFCAPCPCFEVNLRPPNSPRLVYVVIELLPLPYRTASMCVSSSGWIDEVIDRPWVRSSSGATAGRMTTRIASEFVRVSSPSRRESSGSTPLSRIRCNRRCVPHVPAARTTWVAVRLRRKLRERLPVLWTSTTKDPSDRGRTASTVVIGMTVAPARSAR